MKRIPLGKFFFCLSVLCGTRNACPQPRSGYVLDFGFPGGSIVRKETDCIIRKSRSGFISPEINSHPAGDDTDSSNKGMEAIFIVTGQIETAYRIITNLGVYPEYMPYVKESTLIAHKSGGIDYYRMKVRVLLAAFTYYVNYYYYKNLLPEGYPDLPFFKESRALRWDYGGGDLRDTHGIWYFTHHPEQDGNLLVFYRVTTIVSGLIPSAVENYLTHSSIREILAAFRKKLAAEKKIFK